MKVELSFISRCLSKDDRSIRDRLRSVTEKTSCVNALAVAGSFSKKPARPHVVSWLTNSATGGYNSYRVIYYCISFNQRKNQGERP